MSFEPRSVSEESQEASLGSLRGCLVEGDAEQRNRERRVRRRALVISILLQSAVLAALIFVPLFGKTQRIALAYATPVPPYAPYRGAPRDPGAPHPPRGPESVCHFCPPLSIPTVIALHDSHPLGDGPDDTPIDGLVPGIPGAQDGLIPLFDSRRRGPDAVQVDHRNERPRLIHVTTLSPAMLIHRVEPIYPPLARQMRREGRVELQAIIATDGTIQSLEIVGGDVFFYLSAREAVSQWRYKPLILNGQPVEIDTHITVIYTMQH